MDELPMAQGWAFHAWTMENDGWLQFSEIRRASQGYVAQEISRLMKQLDNFKD